MIRALLRLVMLVVVLAAVAYFLGYRLTEQGEIRRIGTAVGTSGHVPQVDATKAREAGAAIGERVAEGASEAQKALTNGALTAKIKSKMALDDTIKAAGIHVDTRDGVVTLTGTVRSQAERRRAVQLAKETQGVTTVTDHLTVR